MTVHRLTATGATARFQGVSADTKPTDAPAGAEFRETDTGALYVWDGVQWVAVVTDAVAAAALTSGDAASQRQLAVWTLRELREIRKLLAFAQGLPALFDPLPPEIDQGA